MSVYDFKKYSNHQLNIKITPQTENQKHKVIEKIGQRRSRLAPGWSIVPNSLQQKVVGSVINHHYHPLENLVNDTPTDKLAKNCEMKNGLISVLPNKSMSVREKISPFESGFNPLTLFNSEENILQGVAELIIAKPVQNDEELLVDPSNYKRTDEEEKRNHLLANYNSDLNCTGKHTPKKRRHKLAKTELPKGEEEVIPVSIEKIRHKRCMKSISDLDVIRIKSKSEYKRAVRELSRLLSKEEIELGETFFEEFKKKLENDTSQVESQQTHSCQNSFDKLMICEEGGFTKSGRIDICFSRIVKYISTKFEESDYEWEIKYKEFKVRNELAELSQREELVSIEKELKTMRMKTSTVVHPFLTKNERQEMEKHSHVLKNVEKFVKDIEATRERERTSRCNAVVST